ILNPVNGVVTFVFLNRGLFYLDELVTQRISVPLLDGLLNLNGTHYKLVANEGKNMLHRGPKGFSRVVWKVKKYGKEGNAPHIIFTYFSHDGFPGDLRVSVTYRLLADNQLSTKMNARALNKATPVNLANHAYWNLGGHGSGNILSDEIQIFASHITPRVDPTGKIASVKGTPYDFLKPAIIGSKINGLPSGYIINYVLDGDMSHKLTKADIVSSNSLDEKGKGGFKYQAHAALCLETQGFPDAVNHPNFPSTIVTPEKPYSHHMLIKFSTKD
ncbi:LOW QUALITY PROTEIN: Aldose 1-/Glucose-6-phosphate 1-epimerase, partial [Dillenia turbinata]